MSTIKSSSEHLTLNADGASKDIKFQANGVEKASIDSSGNVAASGTITSNGQAQLNNNNLISTNTGATGEWIGKRTSSGEGIHITTTNASGTDTQRLAITCNADSADFIVKDSDIVFGTAGKGIVLGSTTNVDANTLDDYEEGTWTPTDGSGAGLTISVNSASYTKIGRLVNVQAYVSYPTNSSTASQRLGGLPFTSPASAHYFPSLLNQNSSTLSGSCVRVHENSTALHGLKHDNSAIQNTELSSRIFIFQVSYIIA
jgi:hypothetical protein